MRYLLPLKSKMSVPNFFPMIDWEDQVALPLAELVRVCSIRDSPMSLEIPGQNTYSLARRMHSVRPSGLSGWSARLYFACPLARLSIILSMSFCLYNKKNITRRLEDMNFISSWQKQYFTHSRRSFVKYFFATSSTIGHLWPFFDRFAYSGAWERV